MPYKDRAKALACARRSYRRSMGDSEKRKARAAKMAAYMRKWYAKNRARLFADPNWVSKRKTAKREWARAHPEVGRQSRLRSLYGISEEYYQALLAAQGGACAICRCSPDKRALHVDHDHESGRIRGLLCRQCNCGIGHMRDSALLLRLAADYVEHFTEEV